VVSDPANGRLHGKVALIAGGGASAAFDEHASGAAGIGEATAIMCAREGAKVVVADISMLAAATTVAAIEAEGFTAVAVQCDVTKEADCRRAVEAGVDTFGELQLLVNNVGIGQLGSVLEIDVDEFARVLDVNLRGQFLMIQNALPAIERAGGGAIVNVSSINALRSAVGVAYETSKSALRGLTRNVALSAGPKNIRVNSVLPGAKKCSCRGHRPRPGLEPGGDADSSRSARLSVGGGAGCCLSRVGRRELCQRGGALDRRRSRRPTAVADPTA